MPFNPADLMSQIYAFFRVLYPASSPQAFLAFEPSGFPVDPEEFLFDGTISAPLAVEWVSHLANKAITFNGGNLQHGSTVVDSFVQLLVDGCQADTADAMALVGQEKNAALVQTGITEASLSGIPDDDYHPIVASPVSWFDMKQTSNWTTYTSGQPPQSTAPPPVAPPILVPPPIVWKVGPPRRLPILIHTGGGGGGPVISPVHGPGHMMPMLAMAAVPSASASTASAMLERPIMLPPSEPRTLAIAAPERLAALNVNLAQSAADNKITTQQGVATSNISLQCEYCTVSLDWPWMPQSFLLTRNWHVPGYAAGAFSNGTGAQDHGMMPVTPSAFLVIRNLTITAQWTGTDIGNLQSAAGFGPFSLAGSSFDASSGKLTCQGMQIIGWFCTALPTLPPSSDPSLSATGSNAAVGPISPAPGGSASTSSTTSTTAAQ